MAKLKYLVIHCTDTPERMNVTPEMIKSWHTDKKPVGRGWSRVGYSDMIMLDGTIKNLRPYNEDDKVQDFEVTNGAKGYNGVSRHIVYVGGRDNSLRKPKATLNGAQAAALVNYVNDFIKEHPEAKVVGHNQLNPNKACPSFDVAEEFIFGMRFPKENFILTEDQEKRLEDLLRAEANERVEEKKPDFDFEDAIEASHEEDPAIGPAPMQESEQKVNYNDLPQSEAKPNPDEKK